MTKTQTPHPTLVDAAVDAYLDLVASNGTAPAVVEDITLNYGDEVIYELLDTSWRLGLRDPDETTAEADAWWDAMQDRFGQVVDALS